MAVVPPDQFAFCGPTYLMPSAVLDCQRSINLYPDPGIASSKNAMGLTGRPGHSLFMTLPLSPVRALWPGHNRMFAVGGSHVYELKNDGTVLTDFGAMAGSTGVGPCHFVQNGGSTSFQLCVLDISSNKIYNVAGGTTTAVFNATAMEYLDGFQIAIATGASLNAAGNPNQINSSNFGDATTWNALNFIIRTDASDLTNGLAVLNGLLFIFGEKTTSIFYNAGNAGFPFSRVNGGEINLGCLAPQSIVKFYNTVMWLGSDGTGYGQVYMMRGMSPVRVSNAAIEFLLQSLGNSLGTLTQAVAYGYQEAGHTFYCLNLVNASYQPYAQLVYDLTTGLWHERAYAFMFPQSFASAPPFPSVFGGPPNMIGDGLSGSIYQASITLPNDDSTGVTRNPITYQRFAPHVTHDNLLHRYNRFELDFHGASATPTLDYSNNGGFSYLGLSTPLAQITSQVAPSSSTRFYTRQLGVSRDRAFAVTIVDNTNLIRIVNALLDLD